MANATKHPTDNAASSNLIRIWDNSQMMTFRVDNSFDVRGKVAQNAKSFAISLGSDASNLNICFKPDLTKGIITCNYKKEGKWGPEQTCPSCPFRKGEEVKIHFSFEVTDSGSIVTAILPDHTHFRFSNPVGVNYYKYVAVERDFKDYSVHSKF